MSTTLDRVSTEHTQPAPQCAHPSRRPWLVTGPAGKTRRETVWLCGHQVDVVEDGVGVVELSAHRGR